LRKTEDFVWLETVAKNIETTKTVNKDVKDRLIDVETQSLRQNLAVL
jgi:hypothetical protein